MNKTKQASYQLTHLSCNDFIAELYNRYGKKLYGYAIKSWKLTEEDAWDLIYKTLYKVIASYKNYTFENEEKFGSYVFKVFINYLRNHYCDNKKDHETLNRWNIDSTELENKLETAVTDAASNPQLELLNEELDKIDDWQRILLLMRSNGSAYSKIALFVNKP